MLWFPVQEKGHFWAEYKLPSATNGPGNYIGDQLMLIKVNLE